MGEVEIEDAFINELNIGSELFRNSELSTFKFNDEIVNTVFKDEAGTFLIDNVFTKEKFEALLAGNLESCPETIRSMIKRKCITPDIIPVRMNVSELSERAPELFNEEVETEQYNAIKKNKGFLKYIKEKFTLKKVIIFGTVVGALELFTEDFQKFKRATAGTYILYKAVDGSTICRKLIPLSKYKDTHKGIGVVSDFEEIRGILQSAQSVARKNNKDIDEKTKADNHYLEHLETSMVQVADFQNSKACFDGNRPPVCKGYISNYNNKETAYDKQCIDFVQEESYNLPTTVGIICTPVPTVGDFISNVIDDPSEILPFLKPPGWLSFLWDNLNNIVWGIIIIIMIVIVYKLYKTIRKNNPTDGRNGDVMNKNVDDLMF